MCFSGGMLGQRPGLPARCSRFIKAFRAVSSRNSSVPLDLWPSGLPPGEIPHEGKGGKSCQSSSPSKRPSIHPRQSVDSFVKYCTVKQFPGLSKYGVFTCGEVEQVY